MIIFTDGDNMTDAILKGKDALSLILWDMEKDDELSSTIIKAASKGGFYYANF